MARSPFDLPGYAEALETERVQRILAFHPVPLRVLEFEITPMTLRQYSLLRLVNSPFLPPFATPTTQQLIQLLWVLNPHFTREESEPKREFFAAARRRFVPPPPPRLANRLFRVRWYFKRKTCEINEANAIDQLRKIILAAFADRPEPGTGESAEYYSDECAIIGELAESSGWSPEEIMAMPMAAIFQHLKRNRDVLFAQHGLDALLSNPSDEIIQQHLAEVNSKN